MEKVKPVEIKESKPSPMHIIARRIAEGSKRGQRTDPYNLAVVVEGGGVAAAISAEMLVTLMKYDPHLNSIDSLHGTSGGGFTIAYAASDDGSLSEVKKGRSIFYEDLNDPKFYNPWRLRHGIFNTGKTSAVDMNYLVEHVMRYTKPLKCEAIIGKDLPTFIYGSGTNGAIHKVDLTKLSSQDEILKYLRLFGTLPILGGRPEEGLTDGGIKADGPPIWEAINHEGVTHVLALLSRPEGVKLPTSSLGKTFAAMLVEEDSPILARDLTTLDRRYAASMRRANRLPRNGEVYVTAVRVPKTRPQIGVMEMDSNKLEQEANYARLAVEVKLERHLRGLNYSLSARV